MLKDITLNEFEDGWMSFEVDMETGMDIWGRLANKDYRWNRSFRSCMFPRSIMSVELVEKWASLVQGQAVLAEGGFHPLSCIKSGESSTTLRWEGTWTPGREVEVDVYPYENTSIVRFNTGTGKPSNFLTLLFECAISERLGECEAVSHNKY